ncbi:major facilitator superfamily domain-containing protein [Mucidula mucida]|nr:major facilitator superfamily domain-containing protein [Mucidula mucida]
MSSTPESQTSTHVGPQEATLTDQSSRLPLRKVLTIFAVLQLIIFLSFMDQTSVSTVLPQISEELGSADRFFTKPVVVRIGWVGTAFLIATCSSQMALARFSDIFGRKIMLTVVIVIFMFGNILCGFAQNAIWLFAARGVSGMGAGGLNSLAMIIVSDIVSLKERGRFQGLISIAVGLGNGLGPLIGGALSTISWRWAFWISPPFLFVSLVPIWIFLPQKPLAGDFIAKVRQIDFLGSLLSMAGAILLLVPISGGGTIYAWNSAIVIAMLTFSVVIISMFLAVQWGFAKMPLLPLRIFRYRTVALIFYLPLYFQEILGHSSIMSGVLLIPMVALQPFVSTACGQLTTRTGYIVPLLQAGCSTWLLGATHVRHIPQLTSHFDSRGVDVSLQYRYHHGVSRSYVNSRWDRGTKYKLQLALVTAQAGAPSQDRAVVTGARNTSRSLGGAIGLAACGNIRNSIVRKQLATISGLSSAAAAQVVTSGLAALDPATDAQVKRQAKDAVMAGIHNVFLSFIPVTALAMLATYFIENRRVYEKTPKDNEPSKDGDSKQATENVIKPQGSKQTGIDSKDNSEPV